MLKHMVKHLLGALIGVLAWFATASPLHAQAIVTDDRGQTVQLAKPAQRVITLSPHATELVFAAGGGERIAATVIASDFPEAAKRLPRIGDGLLPDSERLLLLRPDLVIGWQTSQLSNLDRLRIPTFLSAPQTLAAIPDTIEKLGMLFGTAELAQDRATTLRNKLERLKQLPHPASPVRIFLQIGEPPEFSLNRTHLLSQMIEACGGVNVFAEAAAIAPKISAEGVLAQRPDLILLGRVGGPAHPTPDAETRKYWSRLNLPAALAERVFVMDSDVLYRPGPRLIEAGDAICSMIQQARK